MLIEYLPILIFFLIAIAFACFAIAASFLLGQHKPSAAKQSPYECGMTTVGSSYRRIPIKYYIIAMLFLLFDIEVVFLYPWAVVFKEMKMFAFLSMVVFIGILLIAYIYIWKKGALEWEKNSPSGKPLSCPPWIGSSTGGESIRSGPSPWAWPAAPSR